MKDRLILLASRCYAAVDRRPHLLVLTYHVVGPGGPIGSETIAAELRHLKQHYDVVVPSAWDARRLHRSAMVVADDGHASVYDVLFPIARELGVPLTIAVPTDFVLRRRWLWFDRLHWVLQRMTVPLTIQMPGEAVTLMPRAIGGRFGAILRTLGSEGRERLIDEVAERSGVSVPATVPDEHRPVRVEDLRAMLASRLAELCSHSVTHAVMTRLGDEELQVELEQSRAELEAVAGTSVVSFCYPNGARGDFDARTRSAIVKAGYRLAFTTVEGLNRPPHMDPLELRRIHGHPEYATFRKLASGLGDVQRGLSWSA